MKKIIASLSALAVMLFMAAPAADAKIKITCGNVKNGAGSINVAACFVIGGGLDGEEGKPDIVQKNKFTGGAVVIFGANTGGNTAKNNTGGDSDVSSGNIKGKIEINTNANSNIIK